MVARIYRMVHILSASNLRKSAALKSLRVPNAMRCLQKPSQAITCNPSPGTSATVKWTGSTSNTFKLGQDAILCTKRAKE